MKKNNFNLSEFSSVSLAQWQGQLASDLEKVNRPSNLVKTTLDGIQLQALYSKENYESVNELKTNPGEYPYVRGFNSLVDTPVQMQYRVNIDDQDDFSLNIKKALAHGVKQLIFNFDLSSEKCISALDEEKIEILKELDPEIEIAFEFGEYYIPLIPKVLNRINHDSTFFRIDPISLLLKRGQLSFCIDKHVRFVKDIFHSSKKDDFKRFFNFSSMALARSGANHIQEVSYLVSNAIFWLRQFDKKDWGHLIGNMQFTLSTNNLFFHNIAKVRAFRLVWSRALKVLEVEEFANLIHISTAVPELILSQFDPMMNVLRNTVTNFSSQCAGVDYYLPMA
ncbi:MAG: methylmalonyl-CoA mutase, partial [Thermoproteota archaeon]